MKIKMSEGRNMFYSTNNNVERWYFLVHNWKIRMSSNLSVLAAKSLQSCPTLCNPIDGSPPGSPGILQARTLEWVAISFSNAWKWKVKVKSLSCVQFFTTPWTATYQAPPSMGFSTQEYWSGVPSPSPGQWDQRFLNFSLAAVVLEPGQRVPAGR